MTRRDPPVGLILTPGASADREHATLVALEVGLPEIEVVRLTLGTTSVNKAMSLVIDESRMLGERLGVGSEEIALGGRSFGGRACSMAVAAGLDAAALVLLSYPLHPPGKPDNLRVDHFPEISVPTLVLSGSSDPFGTPDEFQTHLGAIAGPVTAEWISGGHAPRNADPEIVSIVRRFLALDPT